MLAVEQSDAEVTFILGRMLGECERCGSNEGVEIESARTQYHTEHNDDGPEDPNRGIAYCRPCAKEHHEYWDSMWADYYSGRL